MIRLATLLAFVSTVGLALALVFPTALASPLVTCSRTRPCLAVRFEDLVGSELGTSTHKRFYQKLWPRVWKKIVSGKDWSKFGLIAKEATQHCQEEGFARHLRGTT